MRSTSDAALGDPASQGSHALGSLFIGLPVWFVTVATAGMLARFVASPDRVFDSWLEVCFIWAIDLAMAAITLVGLIPLVVLAFQLTRMVHGDGTWRTIGTSFMVQLATSSAVIAGNGGWDHGDADRLGIFWLGLIAVGVVVYGARTIRRTFAT